MKTRQRTDEQFSEKEIAKRRDDAIRRALNTPPKPYKDSKVGKRVKVPASAKKNGA